MTKRSGIDGFIPRRSPGMVGGDVDRKLPPADLTGFGRTRLPQSEEHRNVIKKTPAHTETNALVASDAHGLSRTDIDDSLREIDTPIPENKKGRSKKHSKTPKSKRRIIKWIIIFIVLGLLAAGAYVAYKAISASNSVFNGDIFGLVQQKKLQQDEGGRTNILIFGTSEDDPGHEAAWLTDSIMVLSVNQSTNDAYMVSMPRDLEVKFGKACMTGYSGKINGVYGCNYEDGNDEKAGAMALKETVSDITGLEIQYYAHVNYSVVRDVVNALGTITVNIEGSGGAPGVMDSNFDWKCKGGNAYASRATMIKNCPPNGHFIDYKNGPAELDAEHALYLAQARGDTQPTYGLGRSNPDREQNQQKIIVAIKDKALSTGTLTNIGKVTGLIDAIDKNLRTNFDTSEIRTLMSLAQNIPNESIYRMDLVAEKVMGGDGQPVSGKFDYSEIRKFIKKKFYATGIEKENPHVIVLNGSGTAGVAQAEADKLTALGISIDAVDNAPNAEYTKNIIYRVGKSAKAKTAEKLTALYGVKPQAVESVEGVVVGDDTDYVVIVFKAGATTAPSSQ